MTRHLKLSAMPLLALLGTSAAAETVRYRYDARGRLVQVTRADTPTPTNTRFTFDRADNRVRKTVTAP